MSWRKSRANVVLPLLMSCLAALFLHVSSLHAQSNSTRRFDTGLLWKVETSGAPPSYLFGTIHIDDPRVTDLPDVVARSLDASNSFTMEVALDPDNFLQLATRMVYQDGRDLRGVIGDSLYNQVVAASANLGIPGELLRLLKPWAVALMFVVPPQTTGEVLDFKLFSVASAQKKAIYQLESVDEQVAALEGLSESDQVTILAQALANHDRMSQLTAKLVDAYLRRDLAEMSRINDESDDGAPEYRAVNRRLARRLLDERNLRMVQRMQPQLKAGRAFIAIGALHLYGEHGLLNLLARRGYRVERTY